jgi:hypothetical protein
MLELALHVLDILQNTVEAGATRVGLEIVEDEPRDLMTITVTDNGRGMDEETARRVLDPFYTTRTTRHVGLGLPLYAEAAEAAGGGLVIRSTPGAGTIVEATFHLSHPDRQPLGDMAGTLLAFLLSGRAPELTYRHFVVRSLVAQDREFTFDTASIRTELGGLSFGQPTIAHWLAEFIAEGEAELGNQVREARFLKEKENAQAQIPG